MHVFCWASKFCRCIGDLVSGENVAFKMLEFMFGRAVASEKLCSKKLVL